MVDIDSLNGEARQDVEMQDAGEQANGRTNGGSAPSSQSRTMREGSQGSLSFDVKSEPNDDNLISNPAAIDKVKGVLKKKGTAAKKGTGKPKVPKSRNIVKKGLAAALAAGEAGSSSADETDNGPYCICRGPDDHRFMIGCDVCEDWFHGACVNIDKDLGERLIERFVCPNCTDGKRNYTKYKKTCSLDGCTQPARLYDNNKKGGEHSVFCSNEHCDAWWISMIRKLPTKVAALNAVEVLTQDDFMGLLAGESGASGWKLGDKPFSNTEGLWENGLPTRPGVLSDEEQTFLRDSAAERLALGNEIKQYMKMKQLIEWTGHRHQAAVKAGKLTKDTCGYDYRLDAVTVRHQFAAWLESAEGQATFSAGKLDTPLEATDFGGQDDPATKGMCEKKRCKTHSGWSKLLMNAVHVEIKEATSMAAEKLEAEEILRQQAETRYERRQLERNWVEVVQ